MLIDTGPIIALLNRRDSEHVVCLSAAQRIAEQLLTTWPIVGEAMHLLGVRVGWPAQEALWDLIFAGKLLVHSPIESEINRTAELMRRYRNVPMDLGDASLVACGERLNMFRVFTLDHHFQIYRTRHNMAFDAVP